MLNPEQEAVANHFTGPALVIAGPGSGKTRTVVHRIARLIRKGVDPETVTAVTFTKKAAGEMRERLVHLVGEETATKVFTATFHSLAYHVLKDTGTVRVLPAEQARKLIGEILEDLQAPKKLTAKVAQGAFSRVKNSGGGRRELIALYTDFSPYIERAWDAYEAYKEEKRLLDFDDLLHQAVHELSTDIDLQARWQHRARFLIVDEYQDTNLVQFNLLRLLLTPEENLMAVGDPNQAIYAWRGADFRLILEFKKHFPNATVYKLHTNYRSHNGIVTAAKKVITHNTQREDLDLKALRNGDLPTLVQAQSREDEALAVAEVVKRHLDQGTPRRKSPSSYAPSPTHAPSKLPSDATASPTPSWAASPSGTAKRSSSTSTSSRPPAETPKAPWKSSPPSSQAWDLKKPVKPWRRESTPRRPRKPSSSSKTSASTPGNAVNTSRPPYKTPSTATARPCGPTSSNSRTA